MDDRYLDVLDGNGRTPRECGAVQVYVEAAVEDATFAGMLTLYLQSAYEPYAGGTLTLYAEGEDGAPALPDSQTKFPLPELPKGRVAKWSIPLRFRSKAKSLTIEVDAPISKKAERVRQPWKVFKALRTPTIDELDRVTKAPPPEEKIEPLEGFFTAFGQALTGVFGGGRPKAERSPPIKVQVRDGVPTPLDKDSVEKVWDLGEPMPALPKPSAVTEEPPPPAPSKPQIE
ncbi:MAG: hypothetical protein ACJ790_22130 [Myxococcaceae bacterium]